MTLTDFPIAKIALSPPEAAETMSMSARNLWRLTFDKDIPVAERVPHFRAGRSVRYRLRDLQEWAARQVAATATAAESAAV